MEDRCLLCGGDSEYIYNLNGYKIAQCKCCKTCYVANMPEQKTLDEYYQGFKYCINDDYKELIVNEKFNKWYKDFHLPKNAKMLDIGGGSGYFSLAFEYFGHGKATYIDLDSKACNYVKTLGISSVINDDIANLKSKEKFNFIYSRHVIEHLINPLQLIDNAIDLLEDGGVFVLQMPNGLSRERLTDSRYYNAKKNMLKNDNDYSDKKIRKILYSNKTTFDMAPPRHLWAFSAKGIKSYLETKENISFKIKTKSIMDEVYSPFMGQHKYKNSVVKKVLKPIKSFLRLIHSIPGGKAHLVVVIRKKV